MSEEDTKVICPGCGQNITTDLPLWVWRTKWYCSEKCVRRMMGHSL